MPDADPSLLELFARAFSEPGLLEQYGRRLLRPLDMPWEVFEATLTRFVQVAVAEDPSQKTRHRLRALLAELSPADAMSRWTHDQRHAIARFLAFVADDQPWSRPLFEHQAALAAWRALLS